MPTASAIRDELEAAFRGPHGRSCECCEPFPGGRSPIEVAVEREAAYALVRYDPEVIGDQAGGVTARELADLVELATETGVAAVHEAITAVVARELGRPDPRPTPTIVELEAGERCAAETFDGSVGRRCTRPASFTRDGLPVCRQHARLARIAAFVEPQVSADGYARDRPGSARRRE